jgi:putative copper resistance protein D
LRENAPETAMHLLYLFSVWVHILAATAWVGGMMFLILVVVPWLRKGERARAGAVLRDTGRRFRDIGWVCFGRVLVTGTFNLWMRGVRFTDLVREEWQCSPFGRAVLLKLGVFALVLRVGAVHDFWLGPRATGSSATSTRRYSDAC